MSLIWFLLGNSHLKFSILPYVIFFELYPVLTGYFSFPKSLGGKIRFCLGDAFELLKYFNIRKSIFVDFCPVLTG